MRKAALGAMVTPLALAACLFVAAQGASASSHARRPVIAPGDCTTTTAAAPTTTTTAPTTTAPTTTTTVPETTAPETQPTEGTTPQTPPVDDTQQPVGFRAPAGASPGALAVPRLVPAGPAGLAPVPQQADPCQPQVSAVAVSTTLAHTGSTTRGVALAMGGAMLIMSGAAFALTRRRLLPPR
jgi:LPXTG-motif cell wall-anchored protein